MKELLPIVIDFETDAIQQRPKYPPAPVGVSIKWPRDKKPKYYAWGHPTENNGDKNTAYRALMEAVESKHPLLMQNAKFDLDVMETHFQTPRVPWERVHDTMFLMFLTDPHAPSFQLKIYAEKLLDMPPEEQEAVRDWLIAAGIVKKADRKWGAHISKAPGKLVGEYANGDVIRTLKIFEKLYPAVIEQGMKEAYDRERRLLYILLDNEKEGVRIDKLELEKDIDGYSNAMEYADAWLRKRLKAPNLNVDSDDELAALLDAQGIVTDWVMTKTGRMSTAKKNMTPSMFNDPKVASVLGYRNRLATCLSTFMRPWCEMASSSGGMVFTNWNQVRQPSGEAARGARTGRLSSNPNFQNIPKDFYDKNDGYLHPKFLAKLPELPKVRRYVLPDKGGLFCHRDASQQELRILAHFEDDVLCAKYNEEPDLDIHTFVQDQIKLLTGISVERRVVKLLSFAAIYGQGLGKLAEALGISVDEARRIRDAQLKAVPGLKMLNSAMRDLAKNNEPLRTWGGRLYYCEAPKMINGRMQSFEYKMLNALIQSSAADHTKQAIINYDQIKKEGRFLVTVHDELNISAPKKTWKSEMKLLKEAMENVDFDVPMLSGGGVGENWADVQEV